MNRFVTLIRVFCWGVCLSTFFCSIDWAQGQVLSAIATRRFEPAYHYAPADPWIRTKATLAQTKHYGFFYNCDGEECKRNSPLITWRPHHETDLPPKTRWRTLIRQQLGEIRQRIDDGGCASGNCQ